ncbi:sensor histidine kinase [Streptomyces sp. AJS327]|nr:sensor histidine kinase [Streptomyces sp. AJS327]
MALTVNLRQVHRILTLCCGTAAVGGGLALAVTQDPRLMVLFSWTVLTAGVSIAFTSRFSTWMLAVVWELDVARDTQARLAVAEERLRFSRDLHDVLGRNLSVVALKSELAVQLAQRGPEGQRAALAQMTEVQEIARDSQREVREVVRGYRTAGLENELAGARGVLVSAGIDCEISAEPGAELPKPVQAALGWVVREGTTNVLRHADASNCAIRLRTDEETRTAHLTISNNGVTDGVRGRRDSDQGGGSGLAGLRERLAVLGGSLRTETQPGGGTFQLRAEVPLDGAADAPGTGTRPRTPGGDDAGHREMDGGGDPEDSAEASGEPGAGSGGTAAEPAAPPVGRRPAEARSGGTERESGAS